MNRKKDIIKMIDGISGKYSSYEVFCDWIKCCSISISNSMDMFHGKIWIDRETEYIDTMKKYTKHEREKLSEMFVMLAETLEEDITDVLGQIYMESDMGSKATGQFFTPFHLSELCAEMAIPKPDEKGKYIINEPSSGGGGLIIAAASVLKKRGVNYQRQMEVVAQDLDWKGVYMSYLQFSLLGIRAICIQGNTLSEPYGQGYSTERVFYTPAKMGVLM